MPIDPQLQRFCVVALFEPISVGARFERTEWPAHVTLASNFRTAAPVAQLVDVLHGASLVGRSLTFRFGGLAQFGPQRDVPVRLAESALSHDVHRDLADRLGRLRGFTADEPTHWRDGYQPHLTLRPAIGVGAAEGDTRTASHVALARLTGSSAEIVACLAAEPWS